MATPRKNEEGQDDDPSRLLLKLHVKHPNSDVFADMADSRITAEQRIMELQLEQVGDQVSSALT